MLHASGQADESFLAGLLDDDNEYVRSWAVRLLVDVGPPTDEVQSKLAGLADGEESAYVRLSLAQALPFLADGHRWALARSLASHSEDASDASLPLMLWYGVEPLVPLQPALAVELLGSSRIPQLSRYLARRLTEDTGQTDRDGSSP